VPFPAPAGPRSLSPQIPESLEIALAVRLEGNESAGVSDTRELHHPPGDDLGQLLVVADPDHGDDVGMTGNRVHLADPIDLGQLDSQVGDARRFTVDENKGVHHADQRYLLGRAANSMAEPAGTIAPMASAQPASPPQPSTAQLRPALVQAWAVARARNRARPPLPIPGRLRPLVNAARLPDRMLSTIRQVLEDDLDFRQQVAEVADGEMLGRLAELWLVRPDGWQEELAGLLGKFEGDKRRLDEERDARLAQERISTLEQQVARAQAELQVLRKSTREAAAATEAERQATRRAEAGRRELSEFVASLQSENRASIGQIEALEARVDQLAEELEDSHRAQTAVSNERDVARGAESRLEEELADAREEMADARSELSALRAQMESARQSTIEALSKVAAAGRKLEDSLRDAAASFGLSIESEPPANRESVSGSRERGRPPLAVYPRQKRVPARLPPGVFDDEPAAAEYLVRVKGMTLAVDGYNVSISSWPGRDLPEQRWRLVHALAELVTRFEVTVRLFFDGVESGGRLQPPAVARRRMRVEFSPSTVEADDKIIAFVEALDDARPVTVATNDGRVRTEVARRGANLISVEQLLSVLRRFPDAPG
jgi:predicted RNA-binding protein with PIN domain